MLVEASRHHWLLAVTKASRQVFLGKDRGISGTKLALLIAYYIIIICIKPMDPHHHHPPYIHTND